MTEDPRRGEAVASADGLIGEARSADHQTRRGEAVASADHQIMAELEWRAPTADDVSAWARLLAAIEATDVTGENLTEEDCADEFATPWMRPEVNAWFAFTETEEERGVCERRRLDRGGAQRRPSTEEERGVCERRRLDRGGAQRRPSTEEERGVCEAVAFGWVVHRPGADRYERIDLWGGVHPRWRGQGIGAYLIGWLEARACERLAEVDSGLQPAIRVSTVDTNESAKRLFSRRGFEPVRYFSEMRRELAQPLPDALEPDDVRLAPFAEADDEALRVVHNEVFADHWGSEPIEADDWRQWVTGHRNFRGDLSAVAFAPAQDQVADGRRCAPRRSSRPRSQTPRPSSEELVGYVLSAVYPQDFEVQGYSEGWVNTVGVRRPWRRRGLARALLVRVMRAFADEGLAYAGLGVDTASPTGALGLYESLGYTAERRTTTFELPRSGRSPSPSGSDRPR